MNGWAYQQGQSRQVIQPLSAEGLVSKILNK